MKIEQADDNKVIATGKLEDVVKMLTDRVIDALNNANVPYDQLMVFALAEMVGHAGKDLGMNGEVLALSVLRGVNNQTMSRAESELFLQEFRKAAESQGGFLEKLSDDESSAFEKEARQMAKARGFQFMSPMPKMVQ